MAVVEVGGSIGRGKHELKHLEKIGNSGKPLPKDRSTWWSYIKDRNAWWSFIKICLTCARMRSRC